MRSSANETLLTYSSAMIRIWGLESPDQVSMARSALELILGVTSVEISTEAQHAHVRFDPRRVRLQQFCTALHAVELDAEILEM
ncbi:MAG TPA: heavy metal-associated domain-containing protein [Burkholderiales bacterium]|nr:heavy metal-associated domain-containing protein [Burkholderiales bacterium]